MHTSPTKPIPQSQPTTAEATKPNQGLMASIAAIAHWILGNTPAIPETPKTLNNLIDNAHNYNQKQDIFLNSLTDPKTPFTALEKILAREPSLVNSTHFNFQDSALSYLFRVAPKHPELLRIVTLFKSHSVNLCQIDNQGKTPLHYFCEYAAANENALIILESITDDGVDVNIKTECGQTPLHCLFANAQEKPNLPNLTLLLLEKGAHQSLNTEMIMEEKPSMQNGDDIKTFHYTPLKFLLVCSSNSLGIAYQPNPELQNNIILKTITSLLNQNKFSIDFCDLFDLIHSIANEALTKDSLNQAALDCQNALALYNMPHSTAS